MIYYTRFNGQGRTVLADEFNVDDPFSLSPGDIVDRVVGLGYTPWIGAPQPDLLPTVGIVTEIEREGLSYIVSVSRDAEEIDVQERREKYYGPVE